jgi:hypothetical protein
VRPLALRPRLATGLPLSSDGQFECRNARSQRECAGVDGRSVVTYRMRSSQKPFVAPARKAAADVLEESIRQS